jgi:hypothetical protein
MARDGLNDGPGRGHDLEKPQSVKGKLRSAFHVQSLDFLLDFKSNLSVHFSEADCKRMISITGLSHLGRLPGTSPD